MKKLLLSVLLLTLTLLGQSQCVTVNSAYFTNPSGDNQTFSLNINWTAEGTNHLVAYVMSGDDTIYTTCVQVSGLGSGTSIYNGIVAPNGFSTLSASFCRWTGPCGSGAKCAPDQTIPAGGVLSIKFERVTARLVSSTVIEITIKAATTFDSKTVFFNLRMKDNTSRKYAVQMPQNVQAGETWKVILNRIDGSYTTKKL